MSYVSPRDLYALIVALNPTFRGFSQQDSQEFLRFFLDSIHEELKHTAMPAPAQPVSDTTASSPVGTATADNTSVAATAAAESAGSASDPTPTTATATTSPAVTVPPTATATLSASPSTPTPTSASVATPGAAAAKGPQAGSRRPMTSVIDSVFEARLLSEVTCLTCNRVRATFFVSAYFTVVVFVFRAFSSSSSSPPRLQLFSFASHIFTWTTVLTMNLCAGVADG